MEALTAVPGTLVFFESPRRVAEMLADAAAVLGDRPAAVARELTKFYETVRRGGLAALAETYAAEDPPEGRDRGAHRAALVRPAPADDDEALDAAAGTAPRPHVREGRRGVVVQETGLPRKRVYARAVAL